MDPLSVAASIAGLVSLGDTIFRKLYHYVKDVKSAEKEVRVLKNEIAELNGVLHNVYLIAEDLESSHAQDYSVRPGHVNACLATLYRLEADINKMGLGNKTTLRTKMQKLTWPSKVVDLKQFISEIREHRNNLNFALSADSMTALLRCLSKQDELLQGINDVEAKLREQADIETRIAVDKERQSILDSFLFVNPQEIFQTNLRLRHPTTGFWLIENDKFTGWLRGSDNHLWLSGIPGAGKTVLSSLVIQRCLDQASQQRAVAFFYCDYRDKKSQDMVNVLGTLASQLARQNEQCFQLLQAYASTLKPTSQLPRNPEVEELIKLFKEMANAFEDVRIIVDGLDECGDGDGAADVSRTLKSLVNGHDIISLCCISRDEMDIREAFPQSFCNHIEIAAHSRDLEHYVRSEIEERTRTRRLRVKSNNLKDEIINQLVKRANGMFRWVACQLDHLCTLPTDARRRQALAELPSTLHETYERLLHRIQEQDIPLVTRTLKWIAYASPKLNIEELVEIVSIDEYATELDPEACPDVEELLRLCGSLIRRTSQPFESLELAHFTVLEFLEAIKPDDAQLNQFRLCEGDRISLAKTSLTYLCLPSFNRLSLATSPDGLEDHAFFSYVSKHLLKYLDRFENDENVHERLQELFDTRKTANFTNFMLQHIRSDLNETRQKDEKWIDHVCSHEFTTLHAAAMLHMAKICAWLIEQTGDMNQRSMLGVPLECAVFGKAVLFSETVDLWYHSRHLWKKRGQDTIEVILDAGADCNPDTRSKSCLEFAVTYGPNNLSGPFAMLLRHGATLQKESMSNLLDSEILDILETIDQIENVRISAETRIELLKLAQKADYPIRHHVPLVDVMSEELFFETIAYRVKFGPINELESLTRDDRFSVDMRCQAGSGTILHLAAEYNSTDVVGLLLDLGFDPCQRDDTKRTVLHQAIESGMTDQDLLCRLIQRHAVEAEDEHGRTVWHTAAASGRHGILSLLISHFGSEHPCLWQSSKDDRTPLLEAIVNRNGDCASLLMTAPKVSQTVSRDWRCLHYTVARGLEDFLEEILDHGADPCALSERKENALYYVTSETTPKMLGLLLNRGVDPDHLDTQGRSPLQALLDLKQRKSDFKLFSFDYGNLMISDRFIISRMVTHFSTTSTDIRGKTAWFYFCTKTVSSVIASTPRVPSKNLSQLMVALLQQGALDSIESPDNENGLDLLVDTCMKHVPSDDHFMSFDEFQDKDNKVEYVADFLLMVLCTIEWTKSMSSSPQLVRLLIWSLDKQHRALFYKLLDLKVDVHTTSQFYQGDSAIDFAVKKVVKADMFRTLLNRTSSRRIMKVYAKHGLCRILLTLNSEPEHLEYLIGKLEVLLQLGVDPNVQSDFGLTAAMIVAQKQFDFIKALRLLVRFGADLHLQDRYGLTVLHHAFRSGQVAVLRLLCQEIEETGDWNSSFSLPVYRLMPDDIPAGPLASMVYFGCALTHLASYTMESHTLQYLKERSMLGDVNQTTQEGVAPLHFAVCMRTSETTKWLIDNGADVDMRCGTKQTSALHVALRLGCIENAIVLIEAGAKFVKDSDGVSPETQVHPTIRAEFLIFLDHTTASIPSTVFEILKQDYKVQSDGSLYEAIISDNLEACRSIVQDMSELPEALEECGKCAPLMLAVAYQRRDIAELLLQHGAITDSKPCPRIKRETPLYSTLEMAIELPRFNDILEHLLERCLEQEAHWSLDNGLWRPLHIAAAFNLGALKILIKHLRKHYTLFRQIMRTRHDKYEEDDFIKTCLELKSPHNLSDDNDVLLGGSATIHVAAFNKKPETIEYLLNLGVDVDAKDEDGRTPLHQAAWVGCKESVSMLLQHGALPSSTTSMGRTPLMLAASAGRVDVMSILIQFETQMNSEDHRGQSALHFAASYGKMNAFTYLISVGYNPYKLDEKGCSPICYALSHPHLSSYVYASCFDLTHLVPESAVSYGLALSHRAQVSRFFYTRLSKDSELECVDTLFGKGSDSLISLATEDDIEGMRKSVKAGITLENCDCNGRTALIAACRTGRLPPVAFLVRQGARLEYTYENRQITAYQAARGHQDVIDWLLVKRWTEQRRITASVSNCDDRVGSRAGIRTVAIPLRGRFARKKDVSLFDHAKKMHRIARDGWRIMVPLDWDTVAHLTSLPGEPFYRDGS